MAHGTTSKARLTSVFTQRIQDLERAAESMAKQFRKFDEFRKWHTPDALKEANLYDTPGMSSPTWDRNEINQTYSNDVLGGSGKDGGCTSGQVVMKLQCDFLAAEERAWRARHVNPVRAACLAHGRLYAHSGAKGTSVFSVLKNMLDKYLEAGATEAKGGGSPPADVA